jgi:uncharacterized protein YbbC (DUF1343 family)
MAETPLFQNQECFGIDLRKFDTTELRRSGKINLSWLIEMYRAYPDKSKFFDSRQSKQIGNFDKLAGTSQLREQIIAGKSESEIRQTWEKSLDTFKKQRSKYLLYP